MQALARSTTPKTRSQEMRIVEVTDDGVHIRVAGPPSQTPLSQDATDYRQSASAGPSAGPPPPSPPASAEHMQGEEEFVEEDVEEREEVVLSARTVHLPPIHPVVLEHTSHHRHSSSSSSSRHYARTSPRSPHTLSHRSSMETTSSYRTAGGHSPHISRSTNQSDGTGDSSHTNETSDGFLRPPVLHQRARRNTVSAGMPFPSQVCPLQPRTRTVRSLHVEEERDIDELATDIQKQAEKIRRERISKRVKAAQDAEDAKARQETEAVLTRTASLVRAFSSREDGPLVGNLIGEGHVNYVLMYNMLTGIRIAVSRCQAKVRRPLVQEDFTAAHKYSFDMCVHLLLHLADSLTIPPFCRVGNELTPSAKYDFKFKDYAPAVFRELREDHFQLDPADYLLSLTAKYILSELGSPGKSGSFFYFSRDYRFIIKTIHYTEHNFLRRVLPQYHAHITNNPHTLLSRFYGLHRVKLPRGRKIHFVIMNNLFPPHKDIHETFDLKGSTVGREYPEAKVQENPRAVLKDLNWINRAKTLELGPEKRALLTEQLKRDSDLLRRLRVMDYSLLVGEHSMARGNRDNVRHNTLKVFSVRLPR